MVNQNKRFSFKINAEQKTSFQEMWKGQYMYYQTFVKPALWWQPTCTMKLMWNLLLGGNLHTYNYMYTNLVCNLHLGGNLHSCMYTNLVQKPALFWQPTHTAVSLGGSVGCPSDWWSGGCGFDPRCQHSFMEIWSWNIFYSHYFPFANSRRAFVSFWWKNVHNTG